MTTLTEAVPTETTRARLRDLIAATLDIDADEVTDDLGLHAIPEWSSLDHITLIATIEDHFGCVIEGREVAELTTVAAIEGFLDHRLAASDRPGAGSEPIIHRGLDGIYVDETAITEIDGDAGRLTIRGVAVTDIAADLDFAATADLVLTGRPPTGEERTATADQLLHPPAIPEPVMQVVEALADRPPTVVLRTAISMLQTDPDDAVESQGLTLTAQSPGILALHQAARRGRPDHLSIVRAVVGRDRAVTGAPSAPARFLRLFFGAEPSPLEVEALDLAWRVQAEHGSNASAFAARVTAATDAGVVAAMTAAIATFEGPLHGAAITGVLTTLREVAEPARAAAYIADRFAARQPIMGFGHRVYKTVDPRVVPLRAMAERLADERHDRWAVDVLAAIDEAMAPYRRHGLAMNVDPYAAVIYHLLGFGDDYLTALYSSSRMIGWTAHIAEQARRKVLIRPRLYYRGPRPSHGEVAA